jgi:hypothetical protein
MARESKSPSHEIASRECGIQLRIEGHFLHRRLTKLEASLALLPQKRLLVPIERGARGRSRRKTS